MLGQAWNDPGVVLTGSALVAIVGSGLAIVGRLARSVPQTYQQQVDVLAARGTARDIRIDVLEESNRSCEKRVALLIRVLQRAGIDVPPEVFDA